MSGVFMTPQPVSNKSGIARQNHNYPKSIHAEEEGLVAVGNPHYNDASPELVGSQAAVMMTGTKRMRSIRIDTARAIKEECDNYVNELDYMQGALLDGGIMANPEDPTINVLREMDMIGDELRKCMKRVIKTVTTIQGIGRDVQEMDADERRDYKRRRGEVHGLEKEESQSVGQKIGIRPKPVIGGEVAESAAGSSRGRNAVRDAIDRDLEESPSPPHRGHSTGG
jgi:hypothetical protein